MPLRSYLAKNVFEWTADDYTPDLAPPAQPPKKSASDIRSLNKVSV